MCRHGNQKNQNTSRRFHVEFQVPTRSPIEVFHCFFFDGFLIYSHFDFFYLRDFFRRWTPFIWITLLLEYLLLFNGPADHSRIFFQGVENFDFISRSNRWNWFFEEIEKHLIKINFLLICWISSDDFSSGSLLSPSSAINFN